MPARTKASPAKDDDLNREVGDEAVREKTGRDWSEWRRALDADDCRKMDHKSIARHVHEKYGVGDWWAQMVAVGYERLAGLRQRYQKADGFAASASRTISADLSSLYKAWSDGRTRRRWLGAEAITIRTATVDKSMRITWSDGQTHVDVNFYSKGSAKSQVSIQHRKLADAQAVDEIKTMWASRLDRLKTLLES